MSTAILERDKNRGDNLIVRFVFCLRLKSGSFEQSVVIFQNRFFFLDIKILINNFHFQSRNPKCFGEFLFTHSLTLIK